MYNLKELTPIINKLIDLSKKEDFDVFNQLVWPKEISDTNLWTSPELLTVYGTNYFDKLSEEKIIKLSKLECLYFFSLNVHGIRDLLIDIVSIIHRKQFELISEYLHFLVKEENEHMYYFAKFCLTYGGRLFSDKSISIGKVEESDKLVHFYLVFMRILVFEIIVDFFNLKASKDKNIHPFIQKLNEIHHKDESRHIAFGMKICEVIFKKIKENCSPIVISEVKNYTKNYITYSVDKLYNPSIYREIGFENPLQVKKELLKNSNRIKWNNEIVKKAVTSFKKVGILESEIF